MIMKMENVCRRTKSLQIQLAPNVLNDTRIIWRKSPQCERLKELQNKKKSIEPQRRYSSITCSEHTNICRLLTAKKPSFIEL